MVEKSNHASGVKKAQSIVEFALAVPIILLIILAIIAFGHYFFAYFTVVSSSREAARWGAAVGTSTNGGPRYKDCNAIKDAAVRIGEVVGVRADQINISYDHWENGVLTSPISNCPYDANLNDRIIVEVWIDYKPISPFIDIPSFRLTASTKRTIVMNLPVGVVPTTGPIEPLTYIHVEPSPDASAISSKTGEEQTFNITITASDNTVPPGTVTFKDVTTDQFSSCGETFSPPSPAESAQACSFTFDGIGAHTLTVNYSPTGQYIGALPETLLWVVLAKNSATQITSITPPDQQTAGNGFDVQVHVEAVAPDTGTPGGDVILKFGDETVSTATLDESGNATFTNVVISTDGTHTLTATYLGSTVFGTSEDSISYTIVLE